MAKLNKVHHIHTHEGANAKRITAEQQLSRSVMSCMLWEREFYEDGEDIASRIVRLVSEVSPEFASQTAIKARHESNLRHIPLLICAAMAKSHGGAIVAETIEKVVSRADEMAELVAIICKVNGKPESLAKKVLSAQVKKGLARAFQKFDEYQLAKYNRPGAVRLRDVLFMCHAKPKDKKQHYVWKRLAEDKLKTPDTWEVALSGGADKRETFERLITEGNLGYLALLRNLRNMLESGVDRKLIERAILDRKGAGKVLPFRFVAAARHAKQLEPVLDQALLVSIADQPRLAGATVILVDVSGSMDCALSSKSDLTRMDAAASLASIINCESARVLTFSNQLVEVPPRKGMAGVDAIIASQRHGGTELGAAVATVNRIPHDRLIVITDEQSHSRVPDPVCQKAYMINVASAKNGVGYGKWTHIDGFSESVIRYIAAMEILK